MDVMLRIVLVAAVIIAVAVCMGVTLHARRAGAVLAAEAPEAAVPVSEP